MSIWSWRYYKHPPLHRSPRYRRYASLCFRRRPCFASVCHFFQHTGVEEADMVPPYLARFSEAINDGIEFEPPGSSLTCNLRLEIVACIYFLSRKRRNCRLPSRHRPPAKCLDHTGNLHLLDLPALISRLTSLFQALNSCKVSFTSRAQ